ncbi:hypothetical protein EVAR_99561_1 [Eumeta japonica]|uniref:Uncharacterized protein n=1 Tax=Eumeta variegata TaxID=151549 RepID=A0A4C1YT62_EUMVA|nr:hypothetical protein EVAR_99561_1 [Eumeta japonica]
MGSPWIASRLVINRARTYGGLARHNLLAPRMTGWTHLGARIMYTFCDSSGMSLLMRDVEVKDHQEKLNSEFLRRKMSHVSRYKGKKYGKAVEAKTWN